MAKILDSRSFATGSINENVVLLNNNGTLKGKNTSGVATDIIKLNASNLVELAQIPVVSGTPTAANQLATKSYVDAKVTGLAWRPPVRALSTATTLPTGPAPTVDGYTVANGDRILFVGLSTASQNFRVYIAGGIGNSVSWTLQTDGQAGDGSPTDGDAIYIQVGTTNGDTQWNYNGTAFVQFSGAGQITAGAGLTKSGNSIDVNAGDTSVTVNADSLQVARASGGAVGLAPTGLQVNVDGATISIASNSLLVPSGGIGSVQIAAQAVTAAKLGSDVAGSGLQGGAGSAISAKVENVTMKVNGSGALEGLKANKEAVTLAAADVTNQYVLLSKLYASGTVDVVFNGLVQVEGVDYTLSTSGSVTKVTFAAGGDLASGGGSALVAGDTLRIKGMYL